MIETQPKLCESATGLVISVFLSSISANKFEAYQTNQEIKHARCHAIDKKESSYRRISSVF